MTREDLLTCMAPVAYAPEMRLVNVGESFFTRSWTCSGSRSVADRMVVFLQRALGYSPHRLLPGAVPVHPLGRRGQRQDHPDQHGDRVLGNYARNTPVETLLARNRGGEIPTDVARLDGPRLRDGLGGGPGPAPGRVPGEGIDRPGYGERPLSLCGIFRFHAAVQTLPVHQQ